MNEMILYVKYVKVVEKRDDLTYKIFNTVQLKEFVSVVSLK